MRLPDLPERLLRAACAAVGELRWLDLRRPPGVGETLDWARSLHVVGADSLSGEAAASTLGSLLKDRDDLRRVRDGGVGELIERSRERLRGESRSDAA